MEKALLVRLVEPGTGELDRRLDELGPRDAAESAMCLLEAGNEPGHGDGALADVEDLRRGVAEVDHDLLHLAERLRRRGEEAVEHGRLALEPREQKAATRRIGQGPPATAAEKAATMHVSIALPPSASTLAPASAVIRFPAAIAPCMNAG